MKLAREHPQHPDVVYKVQRDDDDEGTFVLAYSNSRTIGDRSRYLLAHLHVPDENVRHNRWFAGDVYVDEDHRRRGIATQMYNVMAKALGTVPSPSRIKSPDGEALWSSGKLSAIKCLDSQLEFDDVWI